MKRNKIAMLLAMALTVTQSVVVPVAAEELTADVEQEVEMSQDDADAEAAVESEGAASEDAEVNIQEDEFSVGDGEDAEIQEEAEETQNVDFIRFWLGFFRGRHRNLGKMRNPADGFSCGHGGSHRGGVAFFLDYGVFSRVPRGHPGSGRQNLGVFGALRPGHRRVLAVLFPGAAAGGHQQGGSH